MDELGSSELICGSDEERDVAFMLAPDGKEAKTETSNDCQDSRLPLKQCWVLPPEWQCEHELGDSETQAELILQWNVQRQHVLPRKKRVKITRARVIWQAAEVGIYGSQVRNGNLLILTLKETQSLCYHSGGYLL